MTHILKKVIVCELWTKQIFFIILPNFFNVTRSFVLFTFFKVLATNFQTTPSFFNLGGIYNSKISFDRPIFYFTFIVQNNPLYTNFHVNHFLETIMNEYAERLNHLLRTHENNASATALEPMKSLLSYEELKKMCPEYYFRF